MSLLQLPVITVSAPEALILATYGEKSVTFCSGCSSSPTISMSGRFFGEHGRWPPPRTALPKE